MSTSMMDELNQPQGNRGPEITANNLSFQLGTAPEQLAQAQIDYILLSVLDGRDFPFMMYASIRAQKSRVWAMLLELYPKLTIGRNGRGRRDLIRAMAVSQGGLANVESEIQQKPGVLSRNIWNRDWRKDSEKDRF